MNLRAFKSGDTTAFFAGTREDVLQFLVANAASPQTCRLLFFDKVGRGSVDLMIELRGADGVALWVGASVSGWRSAEYLTIRAATDRVRQIFAQYQFKPFEPAQHAAASPPSPPPPRRQVPTQAELVLA